MFGTGVATSADGTRRLKGFVMSGTTPAALSAARKEYTREATPHWHDLAMLNLASCVAVLERRHKM
jgi:hypothetical protein